MSPKLARCNVSISANGLPHHRVNAQAFIRKMPGQTQGNLMLCDDGQLYVVKMRHSPQGPNVLANEMLGTLLAREMGLSVAQGAFVSVSDKVWNDSGPKAWFRRADDVVIHPGSGVAYGSLFVGSPEGQTRTFQYLNSADIPRLSNREDFLGMLILDVWANHQDVRQAVFSRTSPEGELRVTFIDHGQMFGGARCHIQETSYCFYYHLGVYRGLWNGRCVEAWISRLREKAPPVLASYLDGIPREWYDRFHKQLSEVLIKRLDRLEDLMAPYRLRLEG